MHTPKNCDDNNPCTIDTCDATGQCQHTQKNCDDGNVCTKDTCDTATGNCQHLGEGDAFQNCHNGIDDNMNGLIDCADTACCTCPPIRREPTTINLNPSGLDVFRSHGHVKLTHPVDVSSVPVSWLLTNSNGVIYQSTLLPGDFTSNLDGSTLFFKDFGARFGNGVREGMYTALLLVSWKDLVYYKVQAYGDMSMATDPDMVLQFYIGDQAFVFKSTWAWTGHGWMASAPPLVPHH